MAVRTTTVPVATTEPSADEAATLGFSFYGTRGQCQRIRAAVVVECLDLALSPQFIQTGFGRLRSSYEVRVRGPRPRLLVLKSWWHETLSAWQ